MKNWWEEEHLDTDFTKGALALEVISEVYDQPAKQRIFGSPLYDREGNLRCRACGGMMGRSMSKNGLGVSACSDSGCSAHGFEFAEGSYFSNPGRVRA
jgi:hypothetical protein